MKCLVQGSVSQQTRPTLGEMTEEPSWETPHRPRTHKCKASQLPAKYSSSAAAYQVASHKPAQSMASVRWGYSQNYQLHRLLQTMTTFEAERFGVEEGKTIRPNFKLN